MGWSDCGQDSKGRDIGYVFPATCDEKGCSEKIHRGLAYACGNMHGENDGLDCENYFCDKHQTMCVQDEDGTLSSVCNACYERLKVIFGEDEEEGLIIINHEVR